MDIYTLYVVYEYVSLSDYNSGRSHPIAPQLEAVLCLFHESKEALSPPQKNKSLTILRTVRTVGTMPDVKIYVRSEDMDKWNAIEKKSEWLHQKLNSGGSGNPPPPKPINIPGVKKAAEITYKKTGSWGA